MTLNLAHVCLANDEVGGCLRVRFLVASRGVRLALGAVVFAMMAACSGADEPSQRIVVPDQGSGGSTLGGMVSCSPGQTQACYCPDGTETGSQSCLADGKQLSLCVGCKTGAVSGPAPQEVIKDGALCSQLQGQSGCTDQSFRSEELPASILFLVDRSGSMQCNAPEYGQTVAECEEQAGTKFADKPTKWQTTTAALQQVILSLVNSGASAGLSFFSNDDVCGVNSAPAVPVSLVTSTHADALANALTNTTPSGGTPLVGGTILAYAHLYEEAGLDMSGGCAQPPCGAPGNRFVVLITDGADSCPVEPSPGACGGTACTDFLLDDSVHDAVSVNIRTFVIGAPGSEPARGLLSELALSGGTARNGGACDGSRTSASGDCHFDMTSTTDFAADLTTALDAISGSAIGCEFPVPQPDGMPPTENVNVQYRPGGTGAPVCVALDERPCDGGADGFQFAKLPDGSRDLSRVVLCGSACTTVQNDPAVQVDVVLGCKPLSFG